MTFKGLGVALALGYCGVWVVALVVVTLSGSIDPIPLDKTTFYPYCCFITSLTLLLATFSLLENVLAVSNRFKLLSDVSLTP